VILPVGRRTWIVVDEGHGVDLLIGIAGRTEDVAQEDSVLIGIHHR